MCAPHKKLNLSMCQNDRESYFSGDQEAAVGLLPLRGLGATEGPEENSKRLSASSYNFTSYEAGFPLTINLSKDG